MSETLNIALIQTILVWENPAENRKLLSKKISNISDEADVIVLPEMFTSGFTMNAQTVAETMQGETVAWLKETAQNRQVAITGSLVIQENDKCYNRLLFVKPDGSIQQYDKRHTFTLAGEEQVYAHGTQKLIVDYKGWKICPLICYDLRFPVWARNTEDYHVLIYVANWPRPRISAWDALLKARAIENMSYCIGVNRVGTDGNGYEYTGHSAAFDVLGNRLDTIKNNEETIESVTLSKSQLEKYRSKLGFLGDRDEFSLKM